MNWMRSLVFLRHTNVLDKKSVIFEDNFLIFRNQIFGNSSDMTPRKTQKLNLNNEVNCSLLNKN